MSHLLVQGDAVRLPLADASVDLVIGSPPYLESRLYLENGKDLGIARKCPEWVEWMLKVTEEAVRVSRGAVLWVCSGATRDRHYQPGPEGLVWEWYKRGGCMECPCYWHRVGISGSGGDQWFRKDVEYILCFKREPKLAYSDNTAMGHPPKWAPGGAMSHRVSDGTRKNQWGGGERSGRGRTKGGGHQEAGRPSHKVHTKRMKGVSHECGSDMETQYYVPPAIANPGNLIVTEDDWLSPDELMEVLTGYGKTTGCSPDQILCDMQRAILSSRLREWFYGVLLRVYAEEVLQQSLFGSIHQEDREAEAVHCLQPDDPEVESRVNPGLPPEEILLPQVPRERHATSGRADSRRASASRSGDCPKEKAQSGMRGLRGDQETGSSSQRRRPDEQRDVEPSSLVPQVPSQGAQDRELFHSRLRATIQGSGVLQHALPPIQETWRSFLEMREQQGSVPLDGLIRVKVGGGLMGHALAHLNEAPYPTGIPEFFIKSLCPPGGTVLDPYSGSGTTVSVAERLGRIGIGLDLRMSQAKIATQRLTRPHAKVVRQGRAEPEMPLFKELEV